MKIGLFDFQKDALHKLRESLEEARPRASSDSPRAITLSAPTGSGKTVIMTALFEAILNIPDDQLDWPVNWQPQPDAVILWVSDMPELNEQTRLKIETQSDKVHRVSQLVTIDSTFDAERLEGGRIYFINTQKLANDKLLTSEGGDNRTYSFWRTLTNTARAIPDRFYVIIDEAHRGMSSGRGSSAAQSTMQKFIKGHPESALVKMPLIVGVSATPKRFNDLLGESVHTVHKVQVPPEDVRESGLLKERILIHHPEKATRAELGLLEEAARRWQGMSSLWDAYCGEEGVRHVRPILVVQVEDGSSNQLTRTNLTDAVQAIEDAVGRPLGDAELAHAFQETGDYNAGGRTIRKIEASRIEEDPSASVVFFKMALSTGWDCPRAEVMMSFRRAQDHTYIAQLLGRMVRTPLARRIERRAELNDVHLFLPHFDSQAVKDVVEALQNSEDVPPSEAADARELVVLNRREGTEAIFDAMHKLITYRVNAHRAKNDVLRYQDIARRLTIDEIDAGAWDKAKADAVAWIGLQVAVLKQSEDFDRERKALTQVALKTISVRSVTGIAEDEEDYAVETSDLDLDRQFHDVGRSLGNGLHETYRKAFPESEAAEIKLELIIFGRSASAMSDLERKSREAFNTLFDKYHSKFAGLPEHKRTAYEKLRAASKTPSPIGWYLQDTIDFRRNPSDSIWDKHLYVEADGAFRTSLGTWEAGVLAEELVRADTVAWLRNTERKPWSLEIPYELAGKAKPMFPDLLIIRRVGADFKFDILEPHSPALGDNFEKAKGLAKFAENHGDVFDRVELIRERGMPSGGKSYKRLQINRATVRDRLRTITSNSQLDALFDDQS
jgi:type III restriction enzyme